MEFGKEIKKPSISKLLDLLNKPALLGWANKIGLQGIKLADYRKKSMSAGTAIHTEIKNYIEGDVPFTDKGTEISFIEFLDKNEIHEILSIEEKIETDWFQGRLDITLQASDKKYVCDFKSSDAVYLENILQLTAYRMAKKMDHIAVIQVPQFIFKPLQISDFSIYEDILKSLSDIYKAKEILKLKGMPL